MASVCLYSRLGMCECVLLLVLAYVYPSFSACASIQPVCIHEGMCMHTSVSVHVCVFVFSLISSVPAGQFWHLERKTLCIPHGSTASSTELEMGL